MTLNLALSSPAAVVHVGDRLLTTEDKQGVVEPWETTANKAILYVGRGFSLSVSYAGFSRMAGRPTDRWLVEQLLQQELLERFSTRISGDGSTNISPRDMIDRFSSGILRDFYRMPYDFRRLGLEILISGWTWRRRCQFGIGRPRNFTWFISAGVKKSHFRTELVFPRQWAQQRSSASKIKTVSIGTSVGNELLRPRMLNEWDKIPLLNPEIVERGMVDHIRAVSSLPEGKHVGRNCMAIRLSCAEAPRITFYRDVEDASVSHLSYAPWVIGSNGTVCAPTQIEGSGAPAIGIGELEIELRADPPQITARMAGSMRSTEFRRFP